MNCAGPLTHFPLQVDRHGSDLCCSRVNCSQKGKKVGRLERVVKLILSPKAAILAPHCISIFPMSQVEIHYTCILAMHQLFPCNDFHPSIHFALADSVSYYIISFPNKRKQKGLWYLPRLQQSPLVYLISSTAVIHLSIHPPIHQSICCSASSLPSLS